MKTISFFFISIFSTILFAFSSSFAGEIKEVELKDGSVLSGEVLSLTNGVYTIRTESMGTVTIKDTTVRIIRPKGASASAPPSGHSSQVQSLQQSMMADQEVMSMIQSLKDDPAFQKAMEDPAIMQAVTAGDVASLMANPKFLELMNNSTVKNIQQKVAK